MDTRMDTRVSTRVWVGGIKRVYLYKDRCLHTGVKVRHATRGCEHPEHSSALPDPQKYLRCTG
jgi:hypothetical protein